MKVRCANGLLVCRAEHEKIRRRFVYSSQIVMPVTPTTTEVSAPPLPLRRRWLKPTLWATMGVMTISVILYSELPFLKFPEQHPLLRADIWILIPHILGGTLALIIGPLQFSSRLRRRNPKLHRILGRVYVSSVFVAAPIGIVMATHGHYRLFTVAITVQSGTWIIATAAAFLAARNRQIQQHREWMVRSYAVTFTFIASRFPRPIPAWSNVSNAGFAIEIICTTFLALLICDIGLHWHQLTTRRA
jgi:uncharacterized membrane protein